MKLYKGMGRQLSHQANATTSNPTSTAPVQNTMRSFQSCQEPSCRRLKRRVRNR